jgi:hypothetical protein
MEKKFRKTNKAGDEISNEFLQENDSRVFLITVIILMILPS